MDIVGHHALAKTVMLAVAGVALTAIALRPVAQSREPDLAALIGACFVALLLTRSLLRVRARYVTWRTIVRLRLGQCARCGRPLQGAAVCSGCGTAAWVRGDSCPPAANERMPRAHRWKVRRPVSGWFGRRRRSGMRQPELV